MNLTRRSCLLSGAAVLGDLPVRRSLHAQTAQPAGALTAGQVVARIKARVGIPWMTETVDNIPLPRSLAPHEAGRHRDGMARELGWDARVDPKNPRQFVFEGTPLGELVKDMRARLSAQSMRVLGDPVMPINRASAAWGYASLMPGLINTAARPEIDLIVVGETREWELVEYVQDQIAAGRKKALIVVNHVVSEQAGMKYCAEWLKPFISEVPVEFIAAKEPFWSPARPPSGA